MYITKHDNTVKITNEPAKYCFDVDKFDDFITHLLVHDFEVSLNVNNDKEFWLYRTSIELYFRRDKATDQDDTQIITDMFMASMYVLQNK